MAEALLVVVSKIGSTLTEEATKAAISYLSEKVTNLKELPGKMEDIAKELDMMNCVIKRIGAPTDEVVKGWIGEVRILAHCVEDVIDRYSYHSLKLEEENAVKKIFSKASYVAVFSEIAKEIIEIEKKIENVVRRKERWLLPSQLNANPFADIERKRSQDCLLDFIPDDLVGIEENRILLTQWLFSKEGKVITVSASCMNNRVSSTSTLVLSTGHFPQLKTLVLKRMNNVNQVEIRDGALPQIEGLYVVALPNLNKIPQGIEYLRSLKKLWLLNLPQGFRSQWYGYGMQQKMQFVPELRI